MGFSGSTFNMVAGTLYTYPDNFRAQKALVAAKYSGADLKIAEDFVFGESNKAPEFLKKFPLGKVPAFEGSDGTLLTESNAIAYYVANDELRGGSDAASRSMQSSLERERKRRSRARERRKRRRKRRNPRRLRRLRHLPPKHLQCLLRRKILWTSCPLVPSTWKTGRDSFPTIPKRKLSSISGTTLTPPTIPFGGVITSTTMS